MVLQIPDSLAVTLTDVTAHPVIGEASQHCEELVAIALWLVAERAEGDASAWRPLLRTLPVRLASNWPEQDPAGPLPAPAV